MTENTSGLEVAVWDPFVRLAHWVVAVAFFIAYIVVEEPLIVHVWAGYVVGGLVFLRILWGVVGPKHARFTDFVYRPSTVSRYMLDLLLFRAKRYLGHSPAGGAMVVALLVFLLATVVTGVFTYGAEENAGPAAGLYGPTVGAAPSNPGMVEEQEEEHQGKREGHEKEGEDEVLEETHEVLANLTLALVIAHVAGVLLASAVHRENLPRAMVTGRKRTL